MDLGGLLAIETKIADITDKAFKVLGLSKGKIQDMLTNTKSDSLTKQVAGAISVFPIIVTNDIPVNAASVLTQMLELEYANYMALALGNSPKVNIREINDSKYLTKFHTNLSKLESVLCESFNPDNEFECAMGRSLIDRTMNDLTINPSVSKLLMKSMRENMEVKPRFYGLDWLMESGKKIPPLVGGVKDIMSAGKTVSSEIRDWKKYVDDKKETEYRHQQDEEKKTDDHAGKNFIQTYNYKSINDMQPVPVVANIFTVDDNGTPSRAITVVSGVKAKIHPINKAEFIDLAKSDSKGNLLAQIIKLATGETEFFTTILGTDTIKKYAINSSKFHSNGSKMLAVIRRIKDLNRRGGNYKPNATLIISKAAADELKRTVGIDLLDEDEALELCNNLSLIKFVVCDSLGGKLHVLMPGMYDNFSVMSLDTVEKQVDATMDASLTKELRKVISTKGD